MMLMRQLRIGLATLFVVCLLDATLCTNPGVDIVGVGYDVLKGNPDGGVSARGGSDPGILTTRPIFQITPKSDGTYNELIISNYTCANITARSIVVYNSLSYQEELFEDVQLDVTTPAVLKAAAFSLSGHYKELTTGMKVHETVYIDKGVECRLGTVTYKEDQASSDGFSVSRYFAAAVCELPTTYNATTYEAFLDHWGTHVIMEVFIGIKRIQRYVTTKDELFKHIMFYDPTLVVNTKLTVTLDAHAYTGSHAADTTVGAIHYSISKGSYVNPLPIGAKVAPITKAINSKYWMVTETYSNITACENFNQNRRSVSLNLQRALSEYSVEKSTPALISGKLELPLVWPAGTYGLVMAKSGCPSGGVTWSTGWLNQNSEDDNNDNHWSPNAETLLNVNFDHDFMRKEFCMVTADGHTTDHGLTWPAGSYCILKKGYCPKGFTSGHLMWKDSYGTKYAGNLPDGISSSSTTMIYFCCRSDGDVKTSIYLPTDKSFVLFRYGGYCQNVNGMRSEKINVCHTTKDPFESGTYPSIDSDQTCHGLALNYCHYSSQDDFGAIIG